ncbi:hypothetical protein [uncultured Jatrophihabitans sp.]|uniref:hypothetical protein n=1 Tax=uncultured Jatrophihabitans sp. TaxID=1610747 RepID=UPI0035C9D2DF
MTAVAPTRELPVSDVQASLRLQLLRPGDPDLDDVYAFERLTFERSYGVAPAEHDAEFGPYHARSLFVSVAEVDGRVVGMMRLIMPGADPEAEPIKTFVEAALAPWHLDVARAIRLCGIDVRHTWDVATLSVDRTIGTRRATVLGALYHALVNLAAGNDVRYLTMTVDERVRSTLRMVGLPTTALPGARPAPFEGSAASTPAWGNCADMLSQQRQHNPEAHRLIRLGVGLTDVEMPDSASYRLAEPVVRHPISVGSGAGRPRTRFGAATVTHLPVRGTRTPPAAIR